MNGSDWKKGDSVPLEPVKMEELFDERVSGKEPSLAYVSSPTGICMVVGNLLPSLSKTG